ncbi:hypothetical protein [Brumimicrobium aurantiacum]|uniref:Uncharacterized protein n=1 Tax=Brumimicrobium aurantiacum TaxID=1737063 RepID=A0A3E1EVF7_9FLAO|nr:hypothetical protein [Brumimicrobium aurantiacum]RFC53508.1 hypothetical protein DXU93_12125 [Brumimicrobium aurantiacum]
MLKNSSIIGYSLFLFLHLFFLVVCLLNISEFNLNAVVFLLIIVLIGFGYTKIFREKFNSIGHVIEFSVLVLGSLITFYLNNYLGWGAVISSAAVGLAGGLLPYLKRSSTILPSIAIAVYCGSFVGMASTSLFTEVHHIFIASAISGLFYVYTRGLLIGFGGKLGSVAFSGVLATVLLFFLR